MGTGHLIFEPNRGQTAAGTEFLSRGRSYTLHLRPGEAVLALRPVPAAVPHIPGASHELSMRLGGGNLDSEIVGVQPLVGHSNYILGSDPDGWISRVPHFAAVRYRDAYPGIDLIFYGRAGQLEYDFIVNPGIDPSDIRLELEGAEDVSIDEEGNLVLQVGGHEIVQSAPRAYQILGRGARVHQFLGRERPVLQDTEKIAVEAHFAFHGSEGRGLEVGFEVGAYDPGLPLVIDPAVGFSTFLGGSAAEEMPRVAVDRQANVYVAGTTSSIDFPRTALGAAPEEGVEGGVERVESSEAGDATEGEASGGPDAFVTKLSADGSTILYSTYIGGSGTDRANGIVVDSEDNAYLQKLKRHALINGIDLCGFSTHQGFVSPKKEVRQKNIDLRETIVDLREEVALVKAKKLKRVGHNVGCGGGLAVVSADEGWRAGLFCGYTWGWRFR